MPRMPQNRRVVSFGTASVDRIVSLLEQEVLHQRAIETKQVEAALAQAETKELYTFITRLVAVASGFALLWYGKNLAGTMAFIVTIAELVGTSAGKIRQAR